MIAKGKVPVYAQIPMALHKRLARAMREKDLKLVQVMSAALAMWLDKADGADGADGGKISRGGPG